LRTVAYDDALFDDECFHCVLSDADWRRLLLDVDVILDESATLARALCGSWPALAEELGGIGRCEGPLRAHFVWYLANVPAPFAPSAGREAYAGFPPPKDPAYREYADALTDGCRRGESLHYSSDEFERRVLGCLRSAAPPKQEHLEIRRALDGYVTRLCGVEAAISQTSIVSSTDAHVRLINRVGKIQCPLLGAQRVAYVLSSRTSNEVGSFAAHVRARIPWAAQVREGAARVKAIAATTTCQDYSSVVDGRCRSAGLKATEWRKLQGALTDLPAAASVPARALCKSWPELAAELGSDRCEGRLTEYFLSYGMFVGLAALQNK
jgi:hypothetical protein